MSDRPDDTPDPAADPDSLAEKLKAAARASGSDPDAQDIAADDAGGTGLAEKLGEEDAPARGA